jgi:hypothetical protein
MDKVWEEFVADVLSEISTFSQQFSEVVNNYWSGNDTNLDNFKVSEYTHSADAGGTGGMSNEQISTTDSRGTDRILREDRHTPRRDTSHTENIHNGESAWNDERIDRIENEGRRVSEGSHSQNLDNSTLRSISTETSRRAETNGRRYLKALSNNNEVVARKLLDEQAEKNGYETAYLYHGTHKGEPFDSFRGGGAIWVPLLKNFLTCAILRTEVVRLTSRPLWC